ncbi:flagellar motor protein MotB [Exiguobacterium sp. SH3S2]|uniref:flagellar motor protein MotB n=1 Tax=Exiguobacterium TaxID=33986 RepID=UPI0008779850|nr:MULTISPECIES: flagellar motor protein MotB [Exiguobacterium]TCI25019.1 flagellar motor protein MotB [Exiguobacterium sp. SH5S4]TCI34589.1 flagellar motor protein MotB [Exiguobacterium sp. SH4S7]TCI44344.1 flagellar motor protein MotB [Exiguobacterium sp. SH5S32]TCI47229.1 flagellar motor protein MotB [Exiguobacterium sp. SH3S3]TCI50608.1 flagellar motor protein MotB [Exiguobacterium sp. SH1S4]
MKRKKKHDHEEHIPEGWLIPYADLLTLLLALFIVLFASSNVDQTKLNKMSQSFNQVFSGGTSVFQASTASNSDISRTDKTDTTANPRTYELAKLDELKEEVNQYIKKNGLEDEIEATINSSGLVLTIQDRALFSMGEATLDADARTVAQSISGILEQAGNREIVVSGHTDNVPINTARFPSNWELSSARATAFMRGLLTNESLNPNQFTLASYGEYKPIATNETDAGRSKNRRVEVLIKPLVDLSEGSPKMIETLVLP